MTESKEKKKKESRQAPINFWRRLMWLISLLGRSRALLICIISLSLAAVPLVAQQSDTPPAAQAGTSTQSQQSTPSATTSSGGAQTQQGGITPSMLVLPSAPRLPLPTGADYSRSVNSFPNLLAPYMVRNVPSANFGNLPKLEQMIQDGKVMLSLNDALALALADNLD